MNKIILASLITVTASAKCLDVDWMASYSPQNSASPYTTYASAINASGSIRLAVWGRSRVPYTYSFKSYWVDSSGKINIIRQLTKVATTSAGSFEENLLPCYKIQAPVVVSIAILDSNGTMLATNWAKAYYPTVD